MASFYNIFSPSVIGADVHKKSIVCCARFLQGQEWKTVTNTFGTTKNDILQMSEWCHQFNPNFIIMESTGSYWLSPLNYLERADLKVYVVNPRSVKGMIGKKTDTSDAEWLATKGNDGSFKPSYIPTDRWRKLRDVSRNIITLTQEYTRLKNRETKLFLAMGFRIDSVFSDPFGLNAQRAKDAILEGKTPTQVLASIDTRRLKSTQEELVEAFNGDLDSERVRVILSNRKIMTILSAEIEENKQFLLSKVQALEPELFDILQTIPGIDEYHAATLVVEFGGSAFIQAFGCFEKFASWLGLNPGNKESGGKRYPCRSGHGNWAARRCLCEAAHAASHVNGSTLQSRYRSQRARLGTKKAVISAAHYIARMIYIVASRKQPYKDPCVDYEAEAFDRNFKRYVLKAIQYKEKYLVKVANLQTGEILQSNSRNAAATIDTEAHTVVEAITTAATTNTNVEAITTATAANTNVEAVTTATAANADVESITTAIAANTNVEAVTSSTTANADVEAITTAATANINVEAITTAANANADVEHHSDNIAPSHSTSQSTIRTQQQLSLLTIIMILVVVLCQPTSLLKPYLDVDEQMKPVCSMQDEIKSIATLHKTVSNSECVTEYLEFSVPITTTTLWRKVCTNTIRGKPRIII